MQENGKGIFYGVIGVATLVVAIIGATFAFFAASANGAEDAVNTATDAAATLTFHENIDGIKSGLIPINLIANAENDSNVISAAAFASKAGSDENGCKDDRGNNVCSVYEFDVANPNANAQTLYYELKPTTSTFTNLHYAIFKGKIGATATRSNYLVNGTPATDTGAGTAAGTLLATGAFTKDNLDVISLESLTRLFAANAGTPDSSEFTIILWVEDTGANQNETDAGKSFAGGITVSTGTGSGVTGVIAG